MAIEVAQFRHALRVFLRKSEKVARRSGLTPERYLLLLMIKGAPDGSETATISDLIERLQYAQSTVTELVKRAEKVGLIEREQSQVDGRFFYFRLSDEGEQRLAKVLHGSQVERAELKQILLRLERGAAARLAS